MTQVQTMTNQQLNRALAVALGCQVEEHSGTVFFFTVLPNGKRMYHQLPDYAGDPAASLEVQTAAIVKDAEKYMSNLVEVRWVRQDAAKMTELSLIGAADLHLATPRERAEAAYITLQVAT